MQRLFTTRQLADDFGVKEWQVRRLFEDGDLPEPPRFGGKRVITPDLVPRVQAALQRRGWLPELEGAAR